MKTRTYDDLSSSNRQFMWWRVAPWAAYAGTTWFVLDKFERNMQKACGVAVVDDYGTLARVPYNHDSFNQPEH